MTLGFSSRLVSPQGSSPSWASSEEWGPALTPSRPKGDIRYLVSAWGREKPLGHRAALFPLSGRQPLGPLSNLQGHQGGESRRPDSCWRHVLRAFELDLGSIPAGARVQRISLKLNFYVALGFGLQLSSQARQSLSAPTFPHLTEGRYCGASTELIAFRLPELAQLDKLHCRFDDEALLRGLSRSVHNKNDWEQDEDGPVRSMPDADPILFRRRVSSAELRSPSPPALEYPPKHVSWLHLFPHANPLRRRYGGRCHHRRGGSLRCSPRQTRLVCGQGHRRAADVDMTRLRLISLPTLH